MVKARDPAAAGLDPLEQALVHEPVHRLPQGRARQAQPFGQGRFGKPRARLETAAQHERAQFHKGARELHVAFLPVHDCPLPARPLSPSALPSGEVKGILYTVFVKGRA